MISWDPALNAAFMDYISKENLPKFKSIEAQRGDGYKIVGSITDTDIIDLILEKDGERSVLPKDTRSVYRQIRKFCLENDRINPIGLEFVVQCSFSQDGKTVVMVKDSKK